MAEPRDHPRPPGAFVDAPHRLAALGDLALESGEVIRDFGQSYVTHGRLDADGGNAILVCAAIGSTHHRLDFLIGPGRALSPERFFVVAVDPIGNGLSSSPSNSRRQPGMDFPRFSIRDMVRAQARLLRERLGIERLAAVVGASMGGMQALQWAVSEPGMVSAVAAMTPMARTHPWSVAVNETTRRCLLADRAWTGRGFARRPDDGWRAWVGALQLLANRTPAALAEGFGSLAEVVAWLDGRCEQQAAQGFDAHDWLYQSWAYDGHDVGTTPGFDGDTAGALASIRARTLILAPRLDLYNPVEAARFAAEHIRGSRLVELPSNLGHQAAGGLCREDVACIDDALRRLLAA
ncbi:homoserine O-acetyltransferase [Tistlia consotensis]|uniref:Homoserine O-acetyltransferase n=1 Tax=Tistlia consotensis USBA 355 TaxID=560819 RepID=A0A1Y6C0D8_9PROT|nr:alpha/beta fold hydrolase [Tistlia consotensis]SMF38964.1 homoserine O-acetyltransferase [Tistlia consotensis USBA 355]SNR36653.1 homoserine O-acetyltransferase [Tistlia consotensis]